MKRGSDSKAESDPLSLFCPYLSTVRELGNNLGMIVPEIWKRREIG